MCSNLQWGSVVLNKPLWLRLSAETRLNFYLLQNSKPNVTAIKETALTIYWTKQTAASTRIHHWNTNRASVTIRDAQILYQRSKALKSVQVMCKTAWNTNSSTEEWKKCELLHILGVLCVCGWEETHDRHASICNTWTKHWGSLICWIVYIISTIWSHAKAPVMGRLGDTGRSQEPVPHIWILHSLSFSGLAAQVEAVVNFLLIGCFKDSRLGDKLQRSARFRVIRILQWKEHSSTACSRSKFKDMVTKSNTSLFVSHYVNQMWTICLGERQWLDIGPNATKSSAQPYPKCDKIILGVTNKQIYGYVMNEGALTFFLFFFFLLLWNKMLGSSPSMLWEELSEMYSTKLFYWMHMDKLGTSFGRKKKVHT